MEEDMLIIAHADGRQYAVVHDKFHNLVVTADGQTYEQIGFVPVRFESGLPHDPDGLEGGG